MHILLSGRLSWLLFIFVGFTASTAGAQSFGGALAVSDHIIAVGRTPQASFAGSVQVFERDAEGSWQQTAELSAPDGDGSDDRFGRALALSGSVLVVGATDAEGTRGAAYVFERADDGVWDLAARIAPNEREEGDHVGRAVATNGRVVLVSSAGRRANEGVVYAFARSEDGTWAPAGRLEAPDARPNSYFGLALAMDGDHVLVAAPFRDRGVLYGFRQMTDGAWSATGSVEGGTDELNTQALTMAGGRAWLGLPRAQDGIGTVVELAYREDADAWFRAGTLLPFDGPGAGFGTALAVSDGTLWVSAPGAHDGAGGLYAFDASGERVDAVRAWPVRDAVPGAGAGTVLAASGQVVAAGAPDLGYGLVFTLERAGDDWLPSTVLGSRVGVEAVTGSVVRCEDGEAAGYACDGVDLLSFLPVHALGGGGGMGAGSGVVRINDLWGWTDPVTDREYVLLGRVDGLSFVDVTDPLLPVYLGDMPATAGSRAAVWRDVKVYRDHAYVVADGAGQHGVQVFDLTGLRGLDGVEPRTFEPLTVYDGIASAHNIVINEESGYAYTVGNRMGGETCGGGYHIINLLDPANPKFAGCWGHEGTGRVGTGYSHDAQCVIYHGPDATYAGREICFGSNETAISIADLTDKANPEPIASAAYPNVAYTHQGWLSDDHRYLYVNDELDELQGTERTRTLVWDVSDLDEPVLLREAVGETAASDHNLYVKGHLMYQSNYAAGLRILDLSDPTNPVEIAFFDTTPIGDNVAGFTGSWSNYPYFRSGTIAVSSVAEGLFLLRKRPIDL